MTVSSAGDMVWSVVTVGHSRSCGLAFFDDPNYGGRTGDFVPAHRFSPAIQIGSQKALGTRIEISAVFRAREAVALVRINDIGDTAAVLRDGRDDLLGLRLFDARIVRALANEERPHDFIREVQRRSSLDQFLVVR